MVDILRNFLHFLRNPKDAFQQALPFKKKLLFIVGLLLFELPLMLLLDFSIREGLDWLNTDFQHQLSFIEKILPVWVFLLFGVLLMPFIEEVIFRLPLKYHYNPLIGIYNLTGAFFGKKSQEEIKSTTWHYWKKHYGIVFYLSAVLFAFIHIMNFQPSILIFLLSPILVLPQFILGLLIGFIRVKAGFFSGFTFHALHNAVVLLLFLVVLGSPEEKIHQTNNQYELKIEKAGSSFHNSFGFYSKKDGENIDSLAFTKIELKPLISRLTEKKATLITSELDKNIEVNVFFKSFDSTINAKNSILEGIEKSFDVRLKEEEKKVTAWQLTVSDSLKLMKHLIDDASNDKNLKISYSINRLVLNNATIAHLVEELNDEVDDPVFTKVIDSNLYKFKIPRKKGVKN